MSMFMIDLTEGSSGADALSAFLNYRLEPPELAVNPGYDNDPYAVALYRDALLLTIRGGPGWVVTAYFVDDLNAALMAHDGTQVKGVRLIRDLVDVDNVLFEQWAARDLRAKR